MKSPITRFAVKFAADTNLGRAGDDLIDLANAATGHLTQTGFQDEAKKQMLRRLALGAGGGAVGGAGIGALIHAMRAKKHNEEDQPSLLGDTLRGGAAGGILGTIGGGLAAVDAPRELWNAQTLQGKAKPVTRTDMWNALKGNNPPLFK